MKQLPLLSIEESINIHKDMHAKNPSFGMDLYADNFNIENFVILENNGDGNSSVYSRCGHYILVLSLSGKSVRHINQHDYNIEGQTLQLIVPGAIHSFEDLSENQNSLVLLFDEDFLSSGLDSLLAFHKLKPFYINLLGCGFAKIQYIFEQLDYEYKSKSDGYKDISKNLLSQLLLLLKREKLSAINEKIENRAQQIMTQFLHLVEEHYQTKKTIQEYADILEITPKYLSETIKELSKKPALYFIHIRILKELQYLLVYTKLSIKQISSMMNFESASELGRFFKRYEDISPSKYRLSFQKP